MCGALFDETIRGHEGGRSEAGYHAAAGRAGQGLPFFPFVLVHYEQTVREQ